MISQISQAQKFEKASFEVDSTYQSPETANVDTAGTQQFSKRNRGIVLSRERLKRLHLAIVAAEVNENYGNRLTQEELSERMRVSTKTISRLWSLTAGLDQRTLKLCFYAFDLQLTANDYNPLGSSGYTHVDIKTQLSKPKLVDGKNCG